VQRRAVQLADLAVEALIAEALLTPKPALVDLRGPGAHDDLDLFRLVRSAHSLHGTFLRMAVFAAGRHPDRVLREELALLGRAGECDMFAATGGSNAHRGAIWSLGLLVAALALRGGGATPGEVAAQAGRIAAFPDRYAPPRDTHGANVCLRYGARGARGEASTGFPHVVNIGLPALRAARALGIGETCARLDALMAIMASLEDTCLLHRGGVPALLAAQGGARAVLAAGGSSTAAGWQALLRLDADLLARRASPGGCADLLAACLFLDCAARSAAPHSSAPIR
jgi:triphosphoribosyl-dephospho-CoA synthase